MATITKAPLGADDIQKKDSGTAKVTFTRSDSNGQTITLDKLDAAHLQFRSLALSPEDLVDGGYDVTVKVADSINKADVDARAYNSGALTDTTITAAIAANANRRIVLTPGTWTVSGTLTIPSGTILDVRKGAVLTKSGTGTVAFSAGAILVAGRYQIFSGFTYASTTFATGTLEDIYPEWWGAVGDGATDDSTAMVAAIKAAIGARAIVKLGIKTYVVSEGVPALAGGSGNWGIVGKSIRQSIIQAKAASSFLFISISGISNSTRSGGLRFENFQFDGNNTATTFMYGDWLNYSYFSNVRIFQCLGYTGYKAGAIEFRKVEDMQFWNLEILRNGAWSAVEADKVYGMALFESVDSNPEVNGVNSLKFFGGDFERNHDTSLYMDGVYITTFMGTKFHGRTIGDENPNNEVTTIIGKGANQVSFIGCQMSNPRYAAIKFTYSDQYSQPSLNNQITGCSFKGIYNSTTAGDARYIWLKGAVRTSIVGNTFTYDNITDYEEDIWIEDYDGTNLTEYTTIIGELRHNTLPIKNDGTETNNYWNYFINGLNYVYSEGMDVQNLSKLTALTSNGPAGTVTLGAGAATTTVNNTAVTTNSLIFLQPTSANAAADVGSATSVYISAKVASTSFTITHPNNANADKTFNYWIVN